MAESAKDKLSQTGDSAKTSAVAAKDKAQNMAESAKDKLSQASDSVKTSAKASAATAKNKAQSLADSTKDKASEIENSAQNAANSAKDKTRNIADQAKGKASQASDSAKASAATAKDKAQNVAESAKEKASEVGHSTQDTATTVKDKVVQAGHAIAGAAAGAAASVRDTASKASSKIQEAVGIAEDKASNTAKSAKESLSDTSEAAKESVSSAVDKTKETADSAKARASEAANEAGSKATSAKHAASSSAATAREKASGFVHAVEENAISAGHAIQDAFVHAGHAIQDAATAAKDKAAEWLFGAQSAAESAAESTKDAAKDTADAMRDTAKKGSDTVSQKVDNAVKNVRDTTHHAQHEAKTKTAKMMEREAKGSKDDINHEFDVDAEDLDDLNIRQPHEIAIVHQTDQEGLPKLRIVKGKQYKKRPKRRRNEEQKAVDERKESLEHIDAPKAAQKNPGGDWKTTVRRSARNIARDLKGMGSAFMLERESPNANMILPTSAASLQGARLTTPYQNSHIQSGYDSKESKESESKSGSVFGSIGTWFSGKPPSSAQSSDTGKTSAPDLTQRPGTTRAVYSSTSAFPQNRQTMKDYYDSDVMSDDTTIEGPSHRYSTTVKQDTTTRTKFQVEPSIATTTVTIPADVTLVTRVTKPPDLGDESISDLVGPALERVAQTEADMERMKKHALDVKATTDALRANADRAAHDVDELREDLRRATEDVAAARSAGASAVAEAKRRLDSYKERFKGVPGPESTTTATIRLHDEGLKSDSKTIPGKIRKVTEVTTSPAQIKTVEDGRESTRLVPASDTRSSGSDFGQLNEKERSQLQAARERIRKQQLEAADSKAQQRPASQVTDEQWQQHHRGLGQIHRLSEEAERNAQLAQSRAKDAADRAAQATASKSRDTGSQEPSWFRRTFGRFFGMNAKDESLPQADVNYTIYPHGKPSRQAEAAPASYALDDSALTQRIVVPQQQRQQAELQSQQMAKSRQASSTAESSRSSADYSIAAKAPYVPNPVIGETEMLNLGDRPGFVRGIAIPALAVTTTRTYTPGIIIQPAETQVESSSETVVETANAGGLGAQRFPLSSTQSTGEVGQSSIGSWLRGWGWGSDRATADSQTGIGSGAYADTVGFWDSNRPMSQSDAEKIMANRHLPDPIHDKAASKSSNNREYLAAHGDLVRSLPDSAYRNPESFHDSPRSQTSSIIYAPGDTVSTAADHQHAHPRRAWAEREAAVRAKARQIANTLNTKNAAGPTGLDRDLIDMEV